VYLLGYTQNPWDFNTVMCNYILNTKMININKTQQPFITNGVILTNHRSFADFYLDPYLFSCPAISRRFVYFFIGIFGGLSILFNRTIMINRTQDRKTIFSYIKSLGKTLFMFYPEGTRCSHLTLPENYKEVTLSYGLLKSIWEHTDNTRIQIVISKNKDKLFNEKTFRVRYGINVYHIVGEPIYTKEYNTYELFIDKIKLDWHSLWNEVYSYPEIESQ
jgi:1-acyl-sn-glycerol-3-phosphate acyltransferase